MAHKGNKITPVPKCKQCGECCTILRNGVYEDCRFLIRYIKGASCTQRSRCSIYPHRLYAITGPHQYCFKRSHQNVNYPGCPFNKEGQKLHPKFLNKK